MFDCPYPGMAPFAEAQKGFFCGRGKEIDDAVERLSQCPFLVVVGPSGSGKSSLIRAGVIPELRRDHRFGGGEWTIHTLRPSDRRTKQGTAAPTLALTELFGCRANQLTSLTFDHRTLLFVDQFEQVFALAERREATAFMDTLHCLIGRPNLFILLAMRADFYPDLMVSSLWQPVQADRLELVPLGDDQLWEAIVEPAARVGVTVDEALAEKLIADSAGLSYVLPLVQEALVLLWDGVEQRQLGLAAYHRLPDGPDGGLRSVIDRRASMVYEDLSAEARAVARRIFLRLIQLGRGQVDICRRQTVGELRASCGDSLLVYETLAILTQNGLLITSGEARGSGATDPLPASLPVEIAHEVLITCWSRLQAWLGEERAAEQTRLRLEARAEQWLRPGGCGGLLDACELREAENWLRENSFQVQAHSRDLVDLVAASRDSLTRAQVQEEAQRLRALNQAWSAARGERKLARISEDRSRAAVGIARAEARKAVRMRRVIIGLLVVLSITIAAAWLAVRQGQQTVARSLIAESRLSAHDLDLNLATVLALEARRHEPREAERILGNEIPAAFSTAILSMALLGRHGVAVNSVAWSPDGRSLASGSRDGTVRLWDVQGGEVLRTFKGHRGGVLCVAWAPNGRILASGSSDGTIKLWGVEQGEANRTLQGYGVRVSSVAWSSDGRTLASGIDNGTIELWDVAGRKVVKTLQGHEAQVNSVVWSPDGRTLASGSDDGTVRLWDMEGSETAQAIQGHGSTVNSVAWRPDGTALALGSDDGAIKLWDVQLDRVVQTLVDHRGPIRSVTWSPDGRSLASGASDGTITLWDVEWGEAAQIVRGSDGSVNSVAWSPDGHTLASGSYDFTVRLWAVERGRRAQTLQGHSGSVNSIAWRADGRILASGSEDQSVRLWDVERGEVEQTFLGPRARVLSVAWSPDGHTLAVGSDDRSVRLWDLQGGEVVQTLQGHGDRVNSLAWSPDGRVLASAGSHERIIKLWNVRRGEEIQTLRGHEARINCVAWSPDGRTLASGSDDRTVRLWDVEQGQETGILQGHEDWVTSVAWSPDGRTLASAGSHERTIKLWDVGQGIVARVLEGPGDWVLSVAWSPDGRTLATGSDDGTVKVWSMDRGEVIQTLGGYGSRVNSVAWSPDGRTLAAGSGDRTVKLLPELFTRDPCNWVYANLTPAQWLQFKGWSVYRPTCPAATSDPAPSILDAYQDTLEYLLITWPGRLVAGAVCLLCMVLLGLRLRRLKHELSSRT